MTVKYFLGLATSLDYLTMVSRYFVILRQQQGHIQDSVEILFFIYFQ